MPRKIEYNRDEWKKIFEQKTTIELLSDAEVAALTGKKPSTISKMRTECGISPAPKFLKNFVKKHGPDAVSIFRAFVRRKATLQEIGDYFGFTRENARQVYNKIYAIPYSEWKHRTVKKK